MDAQQRPQPGRVRVDRQCRHVSDSVQRSKATSPNLSRPSHEHTGIQFRQRDHRGRYLVGNERCIQLPIGLGCDDKTLHLVRRGLRRSPARWSVAADTVNRIVTPTV
jgi:hypothetical protein